MKRNSIQPFVFRGATATHGGGQQIQFGIAGGAGRVGSVNLRPAGNGVVNLTDLRVDPAHRRQGLGSQLVQAALRTARAQGYHTVTLEARPGTPEIPISGLVSLYRNLGFQSVGLSPRQNPVLARQLTGAPVRSVQAYHPAVRGASIQRMEDTPMGGVTPPGSPRFRDTKQRQQRAIGPAPQTTRPSRRNSKELGTSGHFDIPDFGMLEFKTPLPKTTPQAPQTGRPSWRKSSVYVDKDGNEIFDGSRDSISWLNGFYAWFESQYPYACSVGMGCDTTYEIDHVESFYLHLQRTCTKREVCDGAHHWDAYIARFKDEKFTLPVGLKSRIDNSVVRMYHDNTNLKWMCSRHNSSKSGLHDVNKEFAPDYLSPCPGDKCDV